jgi:two-component system, OmpR family, phosphate regulon sensor histidine kinase PhoR
MQSIISATAWRMLAWLGGLLLLALTIGLIVGEVGVALAIALALWTTAYIWRLLRFDRWLTHRRAQEPPDYDGVWGDIIATVSRIDRRKQFHKQRVVGLLRELRRLTTAMPDGAVLLNSENEIVWFNQRAAQWLKLKRKRDFGIRIENLLRHPDFIDYLQRAQGGTAVEDPPVVPMPGEPNRWVSVYLVHTREAPQRLLIVRDLTHQVLLETMRKEFVANASHELRSPLTVVSGYLDTLGDDTQLEESWREPVNEMRRQAERMRSIIDDLLELSRLEGARDVAGDEPVDIAGLLSVLRKDVLSLPEHPKTVSLSLDSTAKLRGSERELSSVFSNLVTNAVKYTPPDGEIAIRWWVDKEGGHVSVRDTGIGIAPEHIPRLTERFYRVDAGRARAMGGSGLGLAIVKHALQRHGAHLSVESVVGQGSTFVCHFPLARVVAERPAG